MNDKPRPPKVIHSRTLKLDKSEWERMQRAKYTVDTRGMIPTSCQNAQDTSATHWRRQRESVEYVLSALARIAKATRVT